MVQDKADDKVAVKTDNIGQAKAPDGQVLSHSLYSNPVEYQRIQGNNFAQLQSAADKSLQAFDKGGKPEIFGLTAKETSEPKKNGAEPKTDGAEPKKDAQEIKKDTDNKPPAVKLPADFSSIPPERQKQIGTMAQDMLKGKSETNFTEIGKMMDTIAARKDLSELEKMKLWTDVRSGLPNLTIKNHDENPKMIDSWHGAKDPWHALLRLDDTYHAGKLINMSKADADKAILAHEDGTDDTKRTTTNQIMFNIALGVFGVNKGDVEASRGQLEALRALQRNGKFEDYANEWKKQFVVSPRK